LTSIKNIWFFVLKNSFLPINTNKKPQPPPIARRNCWSCPGLGFFSLLALALILMLAGSPVSIFPDETKTTDFGSLTSIAEIPSITPADIRDIEALKALGRPLILGSTLSTEAFWDEHGQLRGFSPHLAQWLTQIFDLEFVAQPYPWNFLMEGLADHSIDFTGELTPTTERHQTYWMSKPIAERSVSYFRLRGADSFQEISRQRTLVFAFLKGSTTSELIRPLSQFPFQEVIFGDLETIYQGLVSGEIDAFVGENPTEAAFGQHLELVDEPFLPLIVSPVSLITANPDLEPIIRVLNKAIDAGYMTKLAEFYTLGANEYQCLKFKLSLTQDEAKYLKEHSQGQKTILFGAEWDNYPVSFYNELEKKWQGISLEVIDQISQLTGLNFAMVSQEKINWPELISMLEKGEISFVTELIYSEERRNRFLWPVNSFQEDNYALLSKISVPNKKINDIFLTKVGLIADTAFSELFIRWFPGHKYLTTYKTTSASFEALESGEIELLMGTRNLNLAMTNYQEKPGFKINMVFPYSFASTFGFNLNEKVLTSIIDKALPLVDTNLIVSHWNRRTFDYQAKLARAKIPWLIGSSVLMLTLLVLTILLLRKRHLDKVRLETLVGVRTCELEAQKEAAQGASRAKGDFLARMSHEIRTPMKAIIGMAELALRETISDEASEMVASIRQAGNSVLACINDILDFSKIESGRMEIIEQEYHFSSLILDTISVINTRLADSNLEFFVEVDNRLPSIMAGDVVRIRQILLNLLSNACKYTRQGHLRLKVEGVISGDFIDLQFAISDTGLGIKEQDLNKLFDNFSQFDQTANQGIEGTGLGLAISRNLATLMGGDIKVESVYGSGSTFTVTIRQRLKPGPPLAEIKNPARARVIILDVNKTLSDSLEWTLTRLGAAKITRLTPEELPGILAAGGHRFLFAPQTAAAAVRAVVKNSGKKIHAVIIAHPGNRVKPGDGLVNLTAPSFCLPVANVLNDIQPTGSSRKKAGKVSFTAPQAAILVVDDLEINLKVVKGLLLPFKIKVDLALSGQEAIGLAESKNYDLIFMDHMMPGMDGLETTRQIRLSHKGATVPIIALTANAVSGIKEIFLEHGMDDFISKPIEIRKLEEILAKWVPSHKKLAAEPDPILLDSETTFLPNQP
jgi:signal transduction histidine kinase/CheY-like chemotaxis protein